jgi:Flp pilus assembly protein TadD
MEAEAALASLAEDVALPVLHRAEILHNLAVVRMQAGRLEDARSLLVSSLALVPGSVPTASLLSGIEARAE